MAEAGDETLKPAPHNLPVGTGDIVIGKLALSRVEEGRSRFYLKSRYRDGIGSPLTALTKEVRMHIGDESVPEVLLSDFDPTEQQLYVIEITAVDHNLIAGKVLSLFDCSQERKVA